MLRHSSNYKRKDINRERKVKNRKQKEAERGKVKSYGPIFVKKPLQL